MTAMRERLVAEATAALRCTQDPAGPRQAVCYLGHREWLAVLGDIYASALTRLEETGERTFMGIALFHVNQDEYFHMTTRPST